MIICRWCSHLRTGEREEFEHKWLGHRKASSNFVKPTKMGGPPKLSLKKQNDSGFSDYGNTLKRSFALFQGRLLLVFIWGWRLIFFNWSIFFGGGCLFFKIHQVLFDQTLELFFCRKAGTGITLPSLGGFLNFKVMHPCESFWVIVITSSSLSHLPRPSLNLNWCRSNTIIFHIVSLIILSCCQF